MKVNQKELAGMYADIEKANDKVWTYVHSLQRAIEYHCIGKDIPEDIAKECPHHATLLIEHRNKDHKE